MSKKSLFFSLVIIVISVLSVFFASSSSPDSSYRRATVTLGKTPFTALVSDTEALRELGLSGHSPLGPRQAMLFVFDKPDMVGFWMKDMKFSLDIVWIGADMRVISFVEGVSPQSYPTIYYPERPSQYVVELPAGALATTGLRKGDTVSIAGGK
ncbi:MAG TPA: DUF192 domain-containing protein [Candidatus Paceibacterota bacterium]|nr:DUF192 domain-containing protein [Candidatus Paceibacterota bacterium]